MFLTFVEMPLFGIPVDEKLSVSGGFKLIPLFSVRRIDRKGIASSTLPAIAPSLELG